MRQQAIRMSIGVRGYDNIPWRQATEEKYAVTNDQVEKHEDAENRRMVKNEGEHTLASGRRGSA